MASKKAKATSVAVTHLIAPNGKTWCGFEQGYVTTKTNDPDLSTCEGCTREWANTQIQNSIGSITASVASIQGSIQGRGGDKPLKDDVDMSAITRTTFTCDGDDADVINDMYMVLTRFLKIGSGDAKLVLLGGDVLDRYKSGNKR